MTRMGIIGMICMLFNASVFATERQYHALVIGNNLYTDPSNQWRTLKTAIADAQEMAKTLRNVYGFDHVKLLENVTRRQIIRALSKLQQQIQPGDNVLVYYAGHGYLDQNSQMGYWVPVDAEGTDDSTFISNSTIRDKVEVIARVAQNTFIISDSCFSGSLLRSRQRGFQRTNEPGGLNSEASLQYYQKVATKKSIQILAAGGVEFVDDNYRRSGHSPFTYFLLKALRDSPNTLFSASELSLNIQRLVADNVKQTPESGVLQGVGHEGGEFVFRKAALQQVPGKDTTQLIPINTTTTGKRHDDKVTFGLQSWYSSWGINSNELVFDGRTSERNLLLGPSIHWRKSNGFIQFNYLLGTFVFDTVDVINSDNSVNSNTIDVERTELDLSAGYYLTHQLSISFGVKRLTDNFSFQPKSANDRSFLNALSSTANGVAIGLSGYWPLTQSLVSDATLQGIYIQEKKTIDNAKTTVNENQYGVTLAIGIGHPLGKTNFSVRLGAKFQMFQNDNSSAERDTFSGLTFALNYTL